MKRRPSNKAIALLVGLNVLVALFVLWNMSNTKEEDTLALANSAKEVEEPNRKANEENEIDAQEEEDIVYTVEFVTPYSADTHTIPLYLSHKDENGAYFTYTQTEQPKTWTQGYWYVDNTVLEFANINPSTIFHNDEIQGVFYGDFFEIQEVVESK